MARNATLWPIRACGSSFIDLPAQGLVCFSWPIVARAVHPWRLDLPEGMDATAIQPEAAAHGVDFNAGTAFFHDGQGRRNIRLAYSFTDEETIRRGIKILAGVIREYLPAKQ